MNKDIKLMLDESDPYTSRIRGFLSKSFPNKIATNHDTLLELITDAIVATKQTRFGPIPQPESLVAMREVIRRLIEAEQPIRFVSPWGSEKPNGSGIDFAELSALKVFSCLQDRIQAHYAPGVQIRLRVEDASAPHLFYERQDEARKEAALYTNGLIKLVQILETPFITIAADSMFVTEEQINKEADMMLPLFETHLTHRQKQEALTRLNEAGWLGGPVPDTMFEFYIASYEKLYPGMLLSDKVHRMARYFAGSLARKRLGLTGALPEWQNDYLEVYFGTTPPGGRLPQHSRRIHYRTIPGEITSKHIAPWRAKGYLRVGDNDVTASVASFHEERQYNEYQMTFERDGLTQIVQADYIIV